MLNALQQVNTALMSKRRRSSQPHNKQKESQFDAFLFFRASIRLGIVYIISLYIASSIISMFAHSTRTSVHVDQSEDPTAASARSFTVSLSISAIIQLGLSCVSAVSLVILSDESTDLMREARTAARGTVRIASTSILFNVMAIARDFPIRAAYGATYGSSVLILSSWKWSIQAIMIADLLHAIAHRSEGVKTIFTWTAAAGAGMLTLDVLSLTCDEWLPRWSWTCLHLSCLGAVCASCAVICKQTYACCEASLVDGTKSFLLNVRWLVLLILLVRISVGILFKTHLAAQMAIIMIDTAATMIPAGLTATLSSDARVKQIRQYVETVRTTRWFVHEMRVPSHNALWSIQEARDVACSLASSQRRQVQNACGLGVPHLGSATPEPSIYIPPMELVRRDPKVESIVKQKKKQWIQIHRKWDRLQNMIDGTDIFIHDIKNVLDQASDALSLSASNVPEEGIVTLLSKFGRRLQILSLAQHIPFEFRFGMGMYYPHGTSSQTSVQLKKSHEVFAHVTEPPASPINKNILLPETCDTSPIEWTSVNTITPQSLRSVLRRDCLNARLGLSSLCTTEDFRLLQNTDLLESLFRNITYNCLQKEPNRIMSDFCIWFPQQASTQPDCWYCRHRSMTDDDPTSNTGSISPFEINKEHMDHLEHEIDDEYTEACASDHNATELKPLVCYATLRLCASFNSKLKRSANDLTQTRWHNTGAAITKELGGVMTHAVAHESFAYLVEFPLQLAIR